MKNVKRFLFGLVAVLAVSGGMAQPPHHPRELSPYEDPRYGDTPEERRETLTNMTYMSQYYNAKDWPQVARLMNELIEKAPRATQNIYIRGANMYRARIAQASTMAERNMYVDSLMYVFDKRIEVFGDSEPGYRAEYLKTKAIDYLTYRPADYENVHKFFNDAINAEDGSKDEDLLKRYFAVLTTDFTADLVDTETYISEYERISGLMATVPTAEEGQAFLDGIFAQTDAANCEMIEKINRPKYEANPNDVELMKKILNMMSRAKCQSDFMLTVAENLYKVDKNPETGLSLASIFEERKDFEKALYYWQEAIDNEKDPVKKADYVLRAAASSLNVGNYRQAAAFAKNCIALDSNSGLAYMILGEAYGSSVGSACTGDDFTKRAGYWLVVDILQKARGMLSGDSEKIATLNSQISYYTSRFPSKEEVFFHNISPGDAYTVSCGWISGSTTVREGK